MTDPDKFKQIISEYLADTLKPQHGRELIDKKHLLSFWRGVFIEYVIQHETLIELVNAIYFVGNDWDKIQEFRVTMYPPETPFNSKSAVFFYIIKKELPVFYNSLDQSYTTNFLAQIAGIRNKLAHYPFIFKGFEGKDTFKLAHLQIKDGKKKEKSLTLTQKDFNDYVAKMWIANDFVKKALIKIAFGKGDSPYIIKKEEQQMLPDFIKPIATNYLTK